MEDPNSDYPRSVYKSENYQKWALTKDRNAADYLDIANDRLQNAKLLQTLHGAIGISGEAGELIDAVKKSVMYGKPLDVVNLKEELGDICWYMAIVLDAIGSSFPEIMQMNHDKLEKRYPSGFSEKDAIARADKTGMEL